MLQRLFLSAENAGESNILSPPPPHQLSIRHMLNLIHHSLPVPISSLDSLPVLERIYAELVEVIEGFNIPSVTASPAPITPILKKSNWCWKQVPVTPTIYVTINFNITVEGMLARVPSIYPLIYYCIRQRQEKK